MFDIKAIRDDPDAFDAGLARRGLEPRAGALLAIDEEARKYTTVLNDLQARRNAASKEIGAAKAKGDEAAFNRLREEVEKIKTQIPTAEAEQKKKRDEITVILEALPNIPAPDVPRGEDEASNEEVRRWGEPARGNAAKEHFELGEALGQMDFETAVKMSGSRFVLLKGDLARLERALANFMLDLHTGEFGYTECQPPLLVRDEALYGTGQLPKFRGDLYRAYSSDEEKFDENISRVSQALKKVKEAGGLTLRNLEIARQSSDASTIRQTELQAKQQFDEISNYTDKIEGRIQELQNSIDQLDGRKWLIPTAEVSLTNIVREEILSEDALPLRFTAWTPCFRSEAGAAGRDTRGMIRLHQFSKVELVSIVAPDASDAEHERMIECAETVLKRLELPYRTMVLCAGDMGFSAKKTYDIEVWLPGQNQYREISSCSNCGDFQARRMNARYRPEGARHPEFVHTLNGSGLAVGRTLVAVLENYQQEDGSIAIPEALRPYMGGASKIEAAR